MRGILLMAAALLLSSGAQAFDENSATLNRIAERGAITVGVRAQSAPFSYIDRGVPRGYVVDLCKAAIAEIERDQQMKIPTIRFVEVTPKTRLERVESGAIDMECGSTTITAERLKKVEFSNMTYVTGLRALTLEKNAIKDMTGMSATLEAKAIAIVDGTTAENVLLWWMGAESSAGVAQRGVKILRVKDYAAGISLVARGQAFAMVGDEVLMQSALSNFDGDQRFAFSQLGYSVEPYGVVLPKSDPVFVEAFNKALAKIYHSGQADRMLSAWLQPRHLQINALTRDALARPGRFVSTPL